MGRHVITPKVKADFDFGDYLDDEGVHGKCGEEAQTDYVSRRV